MSQVNGGLISGEINSSFENPQEVPYESDDRQFKNNESVLNSMLQQEMEKSAVAGYFASVVAGRSYIQ